MSNEINLLFEEIRKFSNYPEGMTRICGEISGTAFFPGGKGTLENSDPISDKPFMILGQDFDTLENFNKSMERGSEDINTNPTWVNLLRLLKKSKIDPEQCFFTNAILGARLGSSNTGRSPGFKSPEFIKECHRFFRFTLEIQRPKLIVVLGIQVAKFLAGFNPALSCWKSHSSFKKLDEHGCYFIKDLEIIPSLKTSLVVLLHPSFRGPNLRHRGLSEDSHRDPEVLLLEKCPKALSIPQ